MINAYCMRCPFGSCVVIVTKICSNPFNRGFAGECVEDTCKTCTAYIWDMQRACAAYAEDRYTRQAKSTNALLGKKATRNPSLTQRCLHFWDSPGTKICGSVFPTPGEQKTTVVLCCTSKYCTSLHHESTTRSPILLTLGVDYFETRVCYICNKMKQNAFTQIWDVHHWSQAHATSLLLHCLFNRVHPLQSALSFLS